MVRLLLFADTIQLSQQYQHVYKVVFYLLNHYHSIFFIIKNDLGLYRKGLRQTAIHSMQRR
jgi:hypothetical protein